MHRSERAVVLYVGHDGAFTAPEPGTFAAKEALKRRKCDRGELASTSKIQKVCVESLPSTVKVLNYEDPDTPAKQKSKTELDSLIECKVKSALKPLQRDLDIVQQDLETEQRERQHLSAFVSATLSKGLYPQRTKALRDSARRNHLVKIGFPDPSNLSNSKSQRARTENLVSHWGTSQGIIDRDPLISKKAQTIKTSAAKAAFLSMTASHGVMKTAAKGSHYLDQTASDMEQFTILRAIQELGPNMTEQERDGAMEALLEIFEVEDFRKYEEKLRTQLFGGPKSGP